LAEDFPNDFMGIYHAFLNKREILNPKELPQFNRHIKIKLQWKFKQYERSDLCLDDELLKELTQICLAAILKNIGTYQPEIGTFIIWVNGVVQNVVRTYFKEMKYEWRNISLEELFELTSPEPLVEQLVIYRENVVQLQSLLQKMKNDRPKYYDIVQYRYIMGQDPKTTASSMNLSIEDVYRISNRALNWLHHNWDT